MNELMYDPNYFLTTLPNIDENEDLREPQKIAYSKCYEHFIEHRSCEHGIIILPTGVGKTGVMALLPYGISYGRILIITPQLVIKDNVVESLNPDYPGNFWLVRKVFSDVSALPNLIEYEGKDTKNEWLEIANIVVVNIQKLQGRLANSLIKRVPPDFFDMIIVDEAHHSAASTWIDTLQYFANAKVIKLTGTPFRTDGKKIAGEILYEYKLSAAMANGYIKSLEKFNYVPDKLYLTIDDSEKQYTVDDLLEEGIKDRDWISRTVAYSIECSEKIVLKSIDKLKEKLSNDNKVPHKIIAVACSIKHAEQIKNLYEKHGFKSAIVHSDMDNHEKQAALKDIENHRVSVIINIAMLGEGYDHPYLSIAAVFRPFRSLLPYAQFIGRVLRAIPAEEASRTTDNIAQVICHQELNLDQLWEYYKKEVQESETIKYLAKLDLEEVKEGETDHEKKQIDKSVGLAKEKGTGKLIGDTYLNTKLIEQRKKEVAEELKKIKEIQELLDITAQEAQSILLQTKGAYSSIKRPDLYVKRKRKGIDARIKEDIVPSLLTQFDINIKSDELKNCRVFKGKYYWIPKRHTNNGAMLALYITNELNYMIGCKRDQWSFSDWDIADQKLNIIEEYLIKVLEDFMA